MIVSYRSSWCKCASKAKPLLSVRDKKTRLEDNIYFFGIHTRVCAVRIFWIFFSV